MKLDHYLIPYTKINKKWIDLYVRTETTKFLEKNIGSKLHDISLGNDLLNLTLKAKIISEYKNDVELHQTKKLLNHKETINKIKRLSMEQDKIFANHIITRD